MRMLLTSALTLAVLAGCGATENKSKAVNAANSGEANAAATQGTTTNSTTTSTASAAVALPGGLPMYPGATNVQQRDGAVTFRAPGSWTDVDQFYLNAARTAGFEIKSGHVGSSARHTLTRGAETVLITGTVILGGGADVEIANGGQ